MHEEQVIQTVLVENYKGLFEEKYYFRMWKAAKTLTHLTSRGWVLELEAFFRDVRAHGIELRFPGGRAYDIPYFFDLFPEYEESAKRWMSTFLESKKTETRMLRISYRSPARIQAIDLYLRCNVARYSDATWMPVSEKHGSKKPVSRDSKEDQVA